MQLPVEKRDYISHHCVFKDLRRTTNLPLMVSKDYDWNIFERSPDGGPETSKGPVQYPYMLSISSCGFVNKHCIDVQTSRVECQRQELPSDNLDVLQR